jgi:hypothetical protein
VAQNRAESRTLPWQNQELADFVVPRKAQSGLDLCA